MRVLPVFLIFLVALLWLPACSPSDRGPDAPGDLEEIPYDPVPYAIKKPDHFPQVPVPADNPMTLEGVQLGRRLFYDPLLSRDSSMSCATCHLPQGSFTDNRAVSAGVDGIEGTRSAMSLLNIAYATNGLFWDGRVRTLEQQALIPIEDPIEMHHRWTEVIEALRAHPEYPARFRKAFGIKDRGDISKELAAKAIAQFERILISSGQSRFDRYQYYGELDALDDMELDGKLMFFDEGPSAGINLPDAQCFHCHGGITLTGNQYFNNGLDSVQTLDAFTDPGRFIATGNPNDKGKFRSPTIRNIALTAPYMHDGRFNTLEAVLDHYGSLGKPAPNLDPLILQIGYPIPGTNPIRHTGLTNYQKKAIVRFLHTLTDTAFIQNPDIQNPF
jgi:cytochrome c peroxidase